MIGEAAEAHAAVEVKGIVHFAAEVVHIVGVARRVCECVRKRDKSGSVKSSFSLSFYISYSFFLSLSLISYGCEASR